MVVGGGQEISRRDLPSLPNASRAYSLRGYYRFGRAATHSEMHRPISKMQTDSQMEDPFRKVPTYSEMQNSFRNGFYTIGSGLEWISFLK
jgi:hypothetical protein